MSFQLYLDPFDVIRIASIVINISFLYVWVKNRVSLRRFLVGKWEGHFKCDEGDGIYFKCQLIVAEQKDRDNAACFYYKAERPEDGVLILKGLDKLQDYKDDLFFVKNRQWKAKFIREFNKSTKTNSEKNIPPFYEWKCDIISLFFRQKMQVKIDASGRIFNGLLTKT